MSSPAPVFSEPALASGAPAMPRVDRARFRQLFTSVMVPMFLAAADQTLLATATPVIARELGGLEQSSWLAVGYLLASVVVVPLYGQWGDQRGRRRVLGGAIALFAFGSLACALAPSFWLLVMARVLQGLGGGGLMTLSQALIGEVVAPQQRARNQGYFAIIFTLASVAGPVFGGFVVEHASWRWLFVVNVPLCAVAMWRLHRLRGEDVPHPVAGRNDWAGLVLFAAALAITLGLLSPAAGQPLAGRVSLGVLALGLWVALMVVERRSGRPFLPVDLLRIPAIRYAVLTVIGFASVMFAMVFYLPIYLQLALGNNAAVAGLQLLPLTAGIVVGAGLTGRLIVWTGRPTLLPRIGLPFAALCLLALGLAPPDERLIIPLGLGTGLGLGCVMSVMQIVTQVAAGPARLGSAAACVSLARSLGSSVGAALFGAVVFAQADVSELRRIATDIALQTELRHAFHTAFVAAAVLALLAAVAASRVPALRFDKEQPAPAPLAE